MTELANDMLCQIIENQTKQAEAFGEMRSDMKAMLRSQDEIKVDATKTRVRVTKIERGNLRHAGFLAGAQFVLSSIGIAVAKKLNWL